MQLQLNQGRVQVGCFFSINIREFNAFSAMTSLSFSGIPQNLPEWEIKGAEGWLTPGNQQRRQPILSLPRPKDKVFAVSKQIPSSCWCGQSRLRHWAGHFCTALARACAQ